MRFEELQVWKDAKMLTLEIYKCFNDLRDFGFKDQIQRASISVMNNIAEGYERKGSLELRRFLYYAKGSAGEIRSMLYIAQDLEYISKEKHSELFNLIESISKQITGFIKSLGLK